MSSTYYTQGQQPGPVNFSSWSETDGHDEPSAPTGSNLPSGSGNFNVPVNQPQPVITQPSQQFSEDPNATKLFREHFRTARDNAIPRSPGSAPSSSTQEDTTSNDHWYRDYWYVFLIIAVVILIVVIYYFKSRNALTTSSSGPQSGLSAGGVTDSTFGRYNPSFGSSALNSANGLLNDLEFL